MIGRPLTGVLMKKVYSALLIYCLFCMTAIAQMRPPAFLGGIPGRSQTQAIFLQRQQARTMLYREALEELRKNPGAADLPVCSGSASTQPCLAAPVATPTPVSVPAVSAEPILSATQQVPVAAVPVPRPSRRIALLFGNNAYQDPIPTLETPIADVSQIAKVLVDRFGFEANILKNATQSQIIEAINKVAADVTPDDNVLLFYAGHGYLMEDIQMGFWIPVGASTKTAKGWISNQDISKLLSAIPAHQLMLISDSCFSGTLTKEAKVSAKGVFKTDELLRRRSVLVLSSGGDEPVSDEGKEGHSIFAWNLIKTLEETSGIRSGSTVWQTVYDGVSKDYPQKPQYGAVISAGHNSGGDYLFHAK
jgi:hypothetical protein